MSYKTKILAFLRSSIVCCTHNSINIKDLLFIDNCTAQSYGNEQSSV